MLVESSNSEQPAPSDLNANLVSFPKQKKFLGIRTSALLEMGIFFAVCFAIDNYFGNSDGFYQVDPHPFWIIILIITVQYGRWEGMVVTIIASLILIFSGSANNYVFGQDVYEHIYTIMKLPIFWLMTSTILGELRLRHIRERDKLRQYLVEGQGREHSITNAYVQMHQIKDRLETMVAGQTQTMISYFKMAQIMEGHDTKTILNGAKDLVSMVLNPDSFSIFLLSKQGLEVVIKEGWSEKGYIELFEPHTPLFRTVIGSQQTLCVARTEDRAILEDQGIIASPLISTDSGNFIGMLKVEKLEFSELNTSNIENFKLLCEWIGIAYDKARRHHRAQSEKMVNEDHKLYSIGFLQRQIEVLSVLGRRNKFDVCLIIIRLTNPQELSQQELGRLPVSIGDLMTLAMRTTDMIFDYDVIGEEFALLLPATPSEHLPLVINKVRDILEKKLAWVAPLAVFEVTSKVVYNSKDTR
ncbi:MAG: GAF domain-containing protein [Magnetococcales bacterium]|nr:GAF domain-containing protein [Magnetococcales bacterium]